MLINSNVLTVDGPEKKSQKREIIFKIIFFLAVICLSSLIFKKNA